MKYRGQVENWDDEKGFGFVQAGENGLRTFVHITAFPSTWRRPVDGDWIVFDVELDEENRRRAVRVRFEETDGNEFSELQRETSGSGAFIALAFLGTVLTCYALGLTPLFILLIYLGLSLLAFVMYFSDKSAAMNRRWRTKESTLQAIAFFGGWPGALLGQRLFRHKISKRSFQFVFRLVVCLNCVMFAFSLLMPSAASLRAGISKPGEDFGTELRQDDRLPLIKPRPRTDDEDSPASRWAD